MSRKPSRIVLEKWLAKKEREFQSLSVDATRHWRAAPRKPDSFAGDPLLGKQIIRNPRTEGEDKPTVSTWKYNLIKLHPANGQIRWKALIPAVPWNLIGSPTGSVMRVLAGSGLLWGRIGIQLLTIALNGDPQRWDCGARVTDGYTSEASYEGLNYPFGFSCVDSADQLIFIGSKYAGTWPDIGDPPPTFTHGVWAIDAELQYQWVHDGVGNFTSLSGGGTTYLDGPIFSVSRTSGGTLFLQYGKIDLSLYYDYVGWGYLDASGSLLSFDIFPVVAEDEITLADADYYWLTNEFTLDNYLGQIDNTSDRLDYADYGLFLVSRGGDGLYAIGEFWDDGGTYLKTITLRKFSHDLSTQIWSLTLGSTYSATNPGENFRLASSIAAFSDSGCVVTFDSDLTLDGETGDTFAFNEDGDVIWSQYDCGDESADSDDQENRTAVIGGDGFVYIAGRERTRNLTP